jgi:hypothetical protein
MICIQLKIKCKIILLKTLENELNKSYFMTYQAAKQINYQSGPPIFGFKYRKQDLNAETKHALYFSSRLFPFKLANK